MHKLTAKDLQDIGLAEHAESYIKQMQRNQSNTHSNLENRPSKRKRVNEAIQEHAHGYD